MNVDQFCEKLVRIKPNNFMAMNGAAAGIIGTSDSADAALNELRKAAITFTNSYKAGEDVTAARKDLIGRMMVATALDVMSEEQADEYLDELHELMQERKQ